MIRIAQGDANPKVVGLQILLNQRGANLNVDGIFGPKTRKAVVAFQSSRGLDMDGIVGKDALPRLLECTGLSVVDAVDITEESDLPNEPVEIKKAGGNPLLTGGMCNGVQAVVNEIRQEATGPSSILLLRFHGHGHAGSMGLAKGKGGWTDQSGNKVYVGPEEMSQIAVENIARLSPVLRTLAPYFVLFGSVELHGCHTGQGAAGSSLLTTLANLWGVPVSAGKNVQYGGAGQTFTFEGPVVTVYPNFADLRSWAKQVWKNYAGKSLAH
jgi:hypothetical protein